MKRIDNRILIAALFSVSIGLVAANASGGDRLKKLGKGAGGFALTKALAGPLDKFINTVTLNRNVPTEMATKVVPVVVVGSDLRIGAVQVTGPKDAVDRVKSVVQIAEKFDDGKVGIEVLVPTTSLRPRKFDRVEGVGITALVDVNI